MKSKLTLLLVIFIIVSCQNKTKNELTEISSDKKLNDTISTELNEIFEKFLRNFEITQLPVEIKGCELSSKDLTELKNEIFSKYIDDNLFIYRQIPTNGKFVATITLGVADCYTPILTTYQLNGEKIDQRAIFIGNCGVDCGYSCSEYMTIKKDYSIYVSDTISSTECDSLGNVISDITEDYVIFKSGKLKTDGKIELSNEIRKELEK